MSDSRIVLALEIGTSKMLALTAEVSDDSSVNILSLGLSTSAGVKKADIINQQKAANLAQAAIVNAERKLSTGGIDCVYLALSGSQIRGLRSVGSANVSGADGRVLADDVERAKEDAKSKTIPQGRSFIHRFSCGFYLDGKYCENPIGQKGNILEAEYWLVHGDDEKMATTMRVVESMGFEIQQVVHSAIASALVVSSQQDRKNGVLVIDIGCGTTDYALFKDSKAVQVGTIAIGGDHITNDVSFGLHVSIKNANKLKLQYGKIVLTEDERAKEIWLNGDRGIGDNVFLYDSLNKIICARFEELFTIIRKELAQFFEAGLVPRVILTGGVSKTKDLDILAAAVLGAPCEMGNFPEWVKPSLCHPEYATALGLLSRARDDAAKGRLKAASSWNFKKIVNIFKR